MLNWVLSLLVHKDVITEDEAKHLSTNLAQSIHSSRFEDAHELISKLLREYRQNK
jgi:hypothetical protein